MHESAPNYRSEAPALDPVRIYLGEIGTVPLLDQAGEVEIAQRRDRGREATEYLSQNPEISEQERFNKELEILDGEVARRDLTEANLRLVVSVARKYQYSGTPLLDLIQDGNTGLMKAVEKFDWRKGFKFSTYATWWIRQAIRRNMSDTGTAIRIPANKSDRIAAMQKLEHLATEMLGKDNVSDEEVHDLFDLKNVEELKELRAVGRLNEILSLDKPVESGEGQNGTVFGDLIADSSAQQAFNAVNTFFPAGYEAKFREWHLTEREIEVVKLRFGLEGGQPLTLQEAGMVFGLTRERIRQIENKAISKARHFAHAEEARQEFLETGETTSKEAIEQKIDKITQRKRSSTARK